MEENVTPLIDESQTEVSEEEPPTLEMLAQRALALKRLFWFLVVLSAIVLAFIVWELFDLIGGMA